MDTYKRKYEEALEKAKMSYRTGDYDKDTLEMLEIIFPELTESEDERIRKWLLDFVQGLPDEGLDFNFYNLSKKQVVAWLEKQGEQKLVWGEKDNEMLRSIMATCELAEQDRDSSPAKHLLETQLNWLESLKDRVQPKQEWSEEDDENIEKILDAIGSYYYLTTDDDILCDWLKSLKQRIGG